MSLHIFIEIQRKLTVAHKQHKNKNIYTLKWAGFVARSLLFYIL